MSSLMKKIIIIPESQTNCRFWKNHFEAQKERISFSASPTREDGIMTKFLGTKHIMEFFTAGVARHTPSVL